MGVRGLDENVRIPSYRGMGSKIAKKKRHMIFECSQTALLKDTSELDGLISTIFLPMLNV